MKIVKKIALLASPLTLFFILLIPYSWLNQEIIVEWLGCGCPVLDEFGNMVENKFNANDFTRLFWFFIALCTTFVSAPLAKRMWKEKKWFQVLYVAGMLAASLWIAGTFTQVMAWC